MIVMVSVSKILLRNHDIDIRPICTIDNDMRLICATHMHLTPIRRTYVIDN